MGVKFEKRAIYTRFTFSGASYSEIAQVVQAIRDVTSARPQGYAYMPTYKSGRWDGYIRLCKGSEFPSGLVPLVVSHLGSLDIKDVQIDNVCTLPDVHIDCIAPDMFVGITLRPYQVSAAKLCCAYSRGVLKMATNSGKTEVIAALAKVVSGHIMVLTTKKDLLYQTATRLSNRLQTDVGIIGDGNWEPNTVTVAMIQTLYRKLHLVDWKLSCVMFDECHHLPSKTCQEVMFGLDAPLRFGFSGTPLRNDNLSDLVLMGATGPVLLEVTNADLIDAGISATPSVDMYVVEASDNYDAKWHDAYDSCVIDNPVRNHIIVDEIKERRAASTLVLVERVRHGDVLKNQLNGAIYVTGSSPMDERRYALEALRKGNGVVVVATAPIFGEGIDAPAVDLLVLAGGGKGHIRLLQNIGRGMRRKDDDNVLSVIDFVDDTNKHLLRHSYARADIYEKEGFEVRIVE